MKIIADENIPFAKESFSRLGEVMTYPGREISPANSADAEVLLVRSVIKVNQELLQGTSVKFVGTATIGTDHIDEDYLKKQGITFAYAPGSNANSVAEYIVAALLTLAKRKNFVLKGKSVGIVGVGNVGSRVEKKCQALGMKILLNDPPLARKTKDKKYLSLEAILSADIVTLHVPLTCEGEDVTYHLANENFFSQMKPNSTFINSSRGAVVDEAALLNTIQDQKLNSVVLDVWENEPQINTELLEKVDLATPHIAGYSFDGKVNGTAMLYEALLRFLGREGKWSPRELLPPPEKEVLTIEGKGKSEEEILREAVKQIYPIEEDDENLRKVFDLPPAEKGKHFDNLRKNYPIRREFPNTKIICQNCSKSLQEKIKGLGFQR